MEIKELVKLYDEFFSKLSEIQVSYSDIKDFNNIDVSFLGNGIYTLCIKTDDSVIARKIMKQ